MQKSLGFLVVVWGLVSGMAAAQDKEKKVSIEFSGGHEIGKKDFGRPVPLIAASLGVSPDVFREAFSGVAPARGRGPTGEEARKNKAALLKVLAPQGVTNERLDEVSDYYRFRPQNGELWPTKSAKGYAMVEEGKVVKIVITEPGAGYCSEPTVKVEGFPTLKCKVTLRFHKDFTKNGAIASVAVLPAK